MLLYLPVIPPILATASAFVALVVAQFFRKNLIAKIVLVSIAGLCAAGAVAATIYNQNQIERARLAEQQRQTRIREQLGSLISVGLGLMSDCSDNTKPSPWDDGDRWVTQVVTYLKENLGASYVVRLRDPAGIPVNSACRGADDQHNRFYHLIYAVNFRLEQFSQQANF